MRCWRIFTVKCLRRIFAGHVQKVRLPHACVCLKGVAFLRVQPKGQPLVWVSP